MRFLTSLSIIITYSMINKLIAKSTLKAIKTLKKIDIFEFSLYMLFSIGCFVMLIQPIYQLPILKDYELLCRFAFAFLAFNLTSIPTIYVSVKNPAHIARLQYLEKIKKENMTKNDFKKEQEKIAIIRKRQQEVLKKFKMELKALEANSRNDTEEELAAKIEDLTNKYTKLLDECKILNDDVKKEKGEE